MLIKFGTSLAGQLQSSTLHAARRGPGLVRYGDSLLRKGLRFGIESVNLRGQQVRAWLYKDEGNPRRYRTVSYRPFIL